MTLILGYRKDDTVWMGCDHLRSSGNSENSGIPPKIWQGSKHDVIWLFGHAGNCRNSQIAQHVMELPEEDINAHSNVFGYLVKYFVPEYRKAVSEGGQMGKSPSGPGISVGSQDRVDSSLLVGIKGHLFSIDNDFGLMEYDEPWRAIGIGKDAAHCGMGVLEEIKSPLSPEERIRLVIQQSQFVKGVGGRITILHT